MSPLGKCGQSILCCFTKNITKTLWKINVPLKLLLSRWSCIFSYVFPGKDTGKLSKSSGRYVGDWAEAAGLVQSREEKARRVLIIPVFTHIRSISRGDRTKLLEIQSEKLEGASHKSYQGKCWYKKNNVWQQVKQTELLQERLWNLHPWRYSKCAQGCGLNSLI